MFLISKKYKKLRYFFIYTPIIIIYVAFIKGLKLVRLIFLNIV